MNTYCTNIQKKLNSDFTSNVCKPKIDEVDIFDKEFNFQYSRLYYIDKPVSQVYLIGCWFMEGDIVPNTDKYKIVAENYITAFKEKLGQCNSITQSNKNELITQYSSYVIHKLHTYQEKLNTIIHEQKNIHNLKLLDEDLYEIATDTFFKLKFMNIILSYISLDEKFKKTVTDQLLCKQYPYVDGFPFTQNIHISTRLISFNKITTLEKIANHQYIQIIGDPSYREYTVDEKEIIKKELGTDFNEYIFKIGKIYTLDLSTSTNTLSSFISINASDFSKCRNRNSICKQKMFDIPIQGDTILFMDEQDTESYGFIIKDNDNSTYDVLKYYKRVTSLKDNYNDDAYLNTLDDLKTDNDLFEAIKFLYPSHIEESTVIVHRNKIINKVYKHISTDVNKPEKRIETPKDCINMCQNLDTEDKLLNLVSQTTMGRNKYVLIGEKPERLVKYISAAAGLQIVNPAFSPTFNSQKIMYYLIFIFFVIVHSQYDNINTDKSQIFNIDRFIHKSQVMYDLLPEFQMKFDNLFQKNNVIPKNYFLNCQTFASTFMNEPEKLVNYFFFEKSMSVSRQYYIRAYAFTLTNEMYFSNKNNIAEYNTLFVGSELVTLNWRPLDMETQFNKYIIHEFISIIDIMFEPRHENKTLLNEFTQKFQIYVYNPYISTTNYECIYNSLSYIFPNQQVIQRQILLQFKLGIMDRIIDDDFLNLLFIVDNITDFGENNPAQLYIELNKFNMYYLNVLKEAISYKIFPDNVQKNLKDTLVNFPNSSDDNIIIKNKIQLNIEMIQEFILDRSYEQKIVDTFIKLFNDNDTYTNFKNKFLTESMNKYKTDNYTTDIRAIKKSNKMCNLTNLKMIIAYIKNSNNIYPFSQHFKYIYYTIDNVPFPVNCLSGIENMKDFDNKSIYLHETLNVFLHLKRAQYSEEGVNKIDASDHLFYTNYKNIQLITNKFNPFNDIKCNPEIKKLYNKRKYTEALDLLYRTTLVKLTPNETTLDKLTPDEMCVYILCNYPININITELGNIQDIINGFKSNFYHYKHLYKLVTTGRIDNIIIAQICKIYRHVIDQYKYIKKIYNRDECLNEYIKMTDYICNVNIIDISSKTYINIVNNVYESTPTYIDHPLMSDDIDNCCKNYNKIHKYLKEGFKIIDTYSKQSKLPEIKTSNTYFREKCENPDYCETLKKVISNGDHIISKMISFMVDIIKRDRRISKIISFIVDDIIKPKTNGKIILFNFTELSLAAYLYAVNRRRGYHLEHTDLNLIMNKLSLLRNNYVIK